MFDKNIILSFFGCFPSYLRPCLTIAKGANSADIEDTCIRAADIRNAYVRYIYIGSTYGVDNYIKSADVEGIYTTSVKYSEIYLQSSRILEVGLFGISWEFSTNIL